MERNTYPKILIGIVAFVVLLFILKSLVIEPWIGNKIAAKFNEKNKDYIVEIDKVHLSIFPYSVEMDSITIYARQDSVVDRILNGQITSIKIIGISLAKALFKKDIEISEVIISNTNIKGKIPFPENTRPPAISTLNIRIDSILFDNIDLAIQNTSNAVAYSVKEGVLKISDLRVEKQDTLTIGIAKHFDFNAKELLSVSADSMYTFTASGIRCS